VGPITGPEKAKFLEKGPKIRKNQPISKKEPCQKKPRINPALNLSVYNNLIELILFVFDLVYKDPIINHIYRN